MRVNAIMTEGRHVFPVNEYGYGAHFYHPGARIVHYDPGRRFNLMLTSNVPNREVNGRYERAWDCIASSYWLMNRLSQNGYNPCCFKAETPVYQKDYFVGLTRFLRPPTLLTLTPGVVSDGLIIRSGVSYADLTQMYLSHGRIADGVSGTMKTVGMEEYESTLLKRSVGLFFNNPEVFEISIMTDLISAEPRPLLKAGCCTKTFASGV